MSFLKWVGGKSGMLPQYEQYIPASIDRYYEPFVGGGAMYFHLSDRISAACLSDLNSRLVCTYNIVRKYPNALKEELEIHQRYHEKDYYALIRNRLNRLNPTSPDQQIRMAADLIYLNKTCFNGLYRENSKGEFNVPMGRYKNPKICDPASIDTASIKLTKASIIFCDWRETLDRVRDCGGYNDFVYLDPPYAPITPTSKFTGYTKYDFKPLDQVALSEAIKELSNIKIMISNSDCQPIRDLYKGFNVVEVLRKGSMNSKTNKRQPVKELLIMNY